VLRTLSTAGMDLLVGRASSVVRRAENLSHKPGIYATCDGRVAAKFNSSILLSGWG
jgi:hypothetical protein